MTQINNNASDFEFEVLAIQSELMGGEFDLKQRFLELNIFEDLFQPFMSASVAVSDATNMPLNLPILGDENLNIQFKTAGMSDATNYNFRSYSINAQKQIKPNQQVFVIECISDSAFQNEQIKVSKSYRNKTVSSIVEDMMGEMDPNEEVTFDIEETSDTIDCIIPNWSPAEAIEWLSKRAIGANGQSDFLFFENGGGKFDATNTMIFASLQTLMQQGNKNDPGSVLHMSLAGSKDKNLPNTVLGWYIDTTFNQIQNIRNGMYGSRLITFDHTLKTISGLNGENDFDYFSSWKKEEHLEDNPVMQDYGEGGIPKIPTSQDFGGSPKANFSVFPKHFEMFTGAKKDNKIERWSGKRKSVLQQMNNYNIQVVVSGNSDMRVGQVVFLDIPSTEHKSDSSAKLDKHRSGKFLVTAIRHKIQRDGYEMILSLTKDSLQSPVVHHANRIT